MSRRGRNNREGGFNRPGADVGTQNRTTEDDKKEREMVGLRFQIVLLKSKYEGTMRDYTDLQGVCVEARALIIEKGKKMSELSERCASWEKKAQQLQQANKNLEDFIQRTNNTQSSAEVQRQEELQLLREKQTKLQTALQDSEKKCGTLEEELRQKLAESEERHLLEMNERDDKCWRDLSQQAETFQRELSERCINLQKHLSEKDESFLELHHMREENSKIQTSLDQNKKKFDALEEELSEKLRENEEHHLLDLAKREDDCRRDLSQQIEKFQKELSERDAILQNGLSERDDRLLEVQRLREENTRLQELFKKKSKKKSFWSRVFKQKKKTPDSSDPSPV